MRGGSRIGDDTIAVTNVTQNQSNGANSSSTQYTRNTRDVLARQFLLVETLKESTIKHRSIDGIFVLLLAAKKNIKTGEQPTPNSLSCGTLALFGNGRSLVHMLTVVPAFDEK